MVPVLSSAARIPFPGARIFWIFAEILAVSGIVYIWEKDTGILAFTEKNLQW